MLGAKKGPKANLTPILSSGSVVFDPAGTHPKPASTCASESVGFCKFGLSDTKITPSRSSRICHQIAVQCASLFWDSEPIRSCNSCQSKPIGQIERLDPQIPMVFGDQGLFEASQIDSSKPTRAVACHRVPIATSIVHSSWRSTFALQSLGTDAGAGQRKAALFGVYAAHGRASSNHEARAA